MSASKLTRRTLALRLFAVVASINLILFFIFWPPTEVSAQAPKISLPQHHIELRLRATLHTSFETHKKAWLMSAKGKLIGPIVMLTQNEDGVSVLIAATDYQHSHEQLIHGEWALIPYIANLKPRSEKYSGVSYEIAY